MRTLLLPLLASILVACKPATSSDSKVTAATTAKAEVSAPSREATPSATRTVSGQVFITLKSRATVKLSLTPVLLARHDVVTQHLSTNRTTMSQARDLAAKRTRAESEVAAAQKEVERLAGIFNGNASQTNRMSKADLQKYLPTHQQLLDSIEAAKDKVKLAVANAELATREFDAGVPWSMGNRTLPTLGQVLFNRTWPGVVGRTTSNADGEFKFSSAPATDLFLIGWSERTIPQFGKEPKVEIYRWVVPVPANSSGEMNLHNDNLFYE